MTTSAPPTATPPLVAEKLTAASVIVLPLPVAWPGGLPCPWIRGMVDTGAGHPGASGRANEVGRLNQLPAVAGSPWSDHRAAISSERLKKRPLASAR